MKIVSKNQIIKKIGSTSEKLGGDCSACTACSCNKNPLTQKLATELSMK